MPSYIGGSTGGAAGSTVATFTVPTGVVEGDLLLFVLVGGSTPTVPAGWALQESGNTTRVYSKYAGASEPNASWTFSSDQDFANLSLAYRGVEVIVDGHTLTSSGTTITAPSITATKADAFLLTVFGYQDGSSNGSTLTVPAGMTSRQYQTSLINRSAALAADIALASSGATTERTSTTNRTLVSASGAGISLMLGADSAPNAPILSVPSTVNRNVTNRFSLTASDPDIDSTSKTEWRYRLIAAPSWTVVSKISPDLFYDFTSGTFLAGDYEIQARTYDASGTAGPYSSSSFFTAADAPDQPTWTDPINGQTIGTEDYTGTISAPSVDESEWRLVADNAGVIDEATVLHGPVLKTTGDLRSHTFTGLTNGVTVWWQARTKFEGLWSQWAAVRTPVAYTAPPVPTFEQTPDNATGSLLVTITNPTPAGSEPAVSYNDVYVGGVRLATHVPPNGSWRWMLPPSGFAGTVEVRAVGTNGTSTSST